MKRFCIGLAGLLVPTVGLADGNGVVAERSDCGGDAHSFAEIVSVPRGMRREPLIAVPDTLCADLQGPRRTQINSLNVYVDPNRNAAPQPGQPGGSPAPNAPLPRR